MGKESFVLECEQSAKTGRSTCKSCAEKIEQGAMRVGYMCWVSGRSCMAWQHPTCLLNSVQLEACASRRGGCQLCKEKMEKGTTKLGLVSGDAKTWFHVRCGLTVLSNLNTNQLPNPDAITGFSNLNEKSQAFVVAVLKGDADAEEVVEEERGKKRKEKEI